MSTALFTHHRFTDPVAAAAAVAVIVGGAAVIGVAMTQSDDGAAPSAPSAPAQVAPNPPSRVGQGDFARPQQGDQGVGTLKGGRSMIGLP